MTEQLHNNAHLNDTKRQFRSDLQLVCGQCKVDGINLIKTACNAMVAGNLPTKFMPDSVSQNVALVAWVATEDLQLAKITESYQDIADQVEKLWTLETLGIHKEIGTLEETLLTL